MNVRVLNEFMVYKSDLNRKSSWQYEKPLEIYTEWLGREGKKVTSQSIGAVNTKVAQEFIMYLKNDMGYSTATIQKYRTVVKALYNFMVKEGYIESNPFKMTEIPYDMAEKSKQKDFLTVEEGMAIVNQARNDIDKAKLLLALEEGMRKTEIVNLRVKDVDLENGVLTFRRKGKGTAIGRLPIMKNVRPYLEKAYENAVRNGSEYVFFSPVNQGRPITEMAMTKLFEGCIARANLSHKKVSIHSLRATAITKIAKEKGLIVAKELANHTSIQTTQRYVRGTDLLQELSGY